MNFNKGISTLIGILIIVVGAVVVVGGVYTYQYYLTPKEVKIPVVSTVPVLLSFNIVPSEKSEQGITYQKGAEAVLKANNLSKVEFIQRGGGTGIYTSTEGGLVGVGIKTEAGNEELWKLTLPSDRRFVEICALGYDSNNNKVGETCLNNAVGTPDQTARTSTDVIVENISQPPVVDTNKTSITVLPLLSGATVANGDEVHVIWKTQGKIGNIGIGFCPQGQLVGSTNCTADTNYPNTGDAMVALSGLFSLGQGKWVVHVIDTTNRTIYSVDNGYFTVKGGPVPLSKVCRVKTYQDKYYSRIGDFCLDNVEINLVYFIAKDQTSEIIPSWSANMKDIFSKTEIFYESQFSNKMQITSNEPQIIYGDKNIGDYATAYAVGQEVKNKLRVQLSPNYFTDLTIFYHGTQLSGGYDGAVTWDSIGGNGSITINPWFWLEKDGMCTITTSVATNCYSYIGVAHEFGHALGMTHPWEMDINKDSNGQIINSGFRYSENGNIMSYGEQKLLSGSVSNPFGGYYIMDEIKQKMIVQ